MYIWIYALVIVAVATLIVLFFVFREKRMKQLEQKILSKQNEEKPAEQKISPAANQKVKEKKTLKQKRTPLQPQAELKDENASQKDLTEEVASPKDLKQEIPLQDNQKQTAELEDFSLDAAKNQTIEDEELRKYKKFLDETFDEFDKDFDDEQDEDDEDFLGDDFIEDDEDLAEQDSSLRERFNSRNGRHSFDDEDELQQEDSMQDLSYEQFEEASKKFLESASKVDKALRGRAPDITEILGEDDVLMDDILKPKFDDDED